MEMSLTEDNNKIKYTVHEALKEYDNRNNKTIKSIQNQIETMIQKSEDNLKLILNQANESFDKQIKGSAAVAQNEIDARIEIINKLLEKPIWAKINQTQRHFQHRIQVNGQAIMDRVCS